MLLFLLLLLLVVVVVVVVIVLVLVIVFVLLLVLVIVIACSRSRYRSCYCSCSCSRSRACSCSCSRFRSCYCSCAAVVAENFSRCPPACRRRHLVWKKSSFWKMIFLNLRKNMFVNKCSKTLVLSSQAITTSLIRKMILLNFLLEIDSAMLEL